MFETLPESRRARSHAGLASVTSLSAHALAVAWAVAAWTGVTDAWRPFDDAEHVAGYASLSVVHAASAVARGRRRAAARPAPAVRHGGGPGSRGELAPPPIDVASIGAQVLGENDVLDTGAPSGGGPRVEDFSPSAVGRVDAAYQRLRLADYPVFPCADNPVPAYPDELLVAQVEGEVLVRFVIDTTGALDPRSIRIITSTNALFAKAVKAVLPEMCFLPAMSDGKPVRAVAERSFAFVIALR